MLPALAACGGSRRVEVPRLAGQILDKRTGKPIEGMAVYQFYGTFNRRASVHEGTGSRDFRWTMTDADGRFEFPAHVVAEALKDHVKIDHVSPRSGSSTATTEAPSSVCPKTARSGTNVMWEIEPEPGTLKLLGKDCVRLCRDLDDDAAFEHCYQLGCGKPVPEYMKTPRRYR